MTLSSSINIIIADDHQMILDGIKDMLAAESGYNVAATAPDGQKVLEIINADPQAFNLLITDISMPGITGIELCRKVKAAYPHIQVLVLSMYSSTEAVQEAVMAEADGYMLKNSGKQELITALHRITQGGTYFSEAILPIIYKQYQKAKIKDELLHQLSARELEILLLIVKEQTSEEIANKLFISKKTVDNHRANILEKTGCKTTIGLVKWAIRNGIE